MKCTAFLLLTLCVATWASSNVVYYEPELPLELSNEIHPYAWSHRLPLPYYTAAHTPYAPLPAFESFIAIQSHIPTQQAQRMTHSPALLELGTYSTAKATAMTSARVGFIFGSSKQEQDAAKFDPADTTPINLAPNPSPFNTADNQDVGNGYKNSFRRAVYGLRRRRMPFTGNSEMFSLNPFRRPNSVFNTPSDLLFPRQRFAAAVNPKLTDFGNLGSVSAAYGGYSSFKGHQFRRDVSDGSKGQGNVPMGGFPAVASTVAAIGFAPNTNVGAMGSSFSPSANSRWNGEMFTPTMNPLASGPSPFIGGGGYTFHDWYGADSAAASAGAATAPAAAADQAPAA